MQSVRDFPRSLVILGPVRVLIALLITVLGCGGVTATQRLDKEASSAEATAEPVPIRAERLRELVEILASDAFAGRGTLEEGETRAAEYLSSEFARIGLRPLPGSRSFLAPAHLEAQGFDPRRTVATLHRGHARRTIRGGVHFKPFSFSRPGAVSGEVVFAGYGISRPDLDHDDYAGLDVKDKVVLVLRHAPKRDDKDKRFARSRDAFFAKKAELARKRGAAAMILVNDPRSTTPKSPEAARGGEDMRMSGRLTLPSDSDRSVLQSIAAFFGRLGSKAPPAIPAIFVSGEIADWMAESMGMSLSAAQRQLDLGQSTARTLAFKEPLRVDLEIGALVDAKPVSATNVVAFLPGRTRPDEWVVVGAHYDHLGHFDGDGDTIYNGADDNASGTAAMLAVAEAIATGPGLERSVVFVGFSAEEKGLLGSKSLASGPLGPEHVVFMINMDMLGRNPDKPVYVGGDGYARGLAEIIESANRDLNLKLELGGTALSGNSDHYPFYRRGIPVMNLFTGLHSDYHQLSDHPSKLDYSRMEKIAHLAAAVTTAMANAKGGPRFIHRPMWLGAAFEVEGKGAAARALITEVEADSPAARAGLEIGDALAAIRDDEGFERGKVSHVLEAIEPGTRARLTIDRDGRPHDIWVVRAKRGYLGVYTRAVSEETQKRYGLAAAQGVGIEGVAKGGPAQKAGIQKSDVLVEIGGQAVGLATLRLRLSRIGAGEKVPVVLIRGGKRLRLTMVLGERPKRGR